MENQTFEEALALWLAMQVIGKKPTTTRFYNFVAVKIKNHWPNTKQPVSSITAMDILDFAKHVAHLSPSYWNSCVAALRFIAPQHTRVIKRRAIKARNFIPPNQEQFEAFLRECDASTRSYAGLVVRFLALTGLRWGQAQSIRWEHVSEAGIEVPGQKNGIPHVVPCVAGLSEVLHRLKQLEFNGYVLPREHPRRAINNASKRAGIVRLTPHKFRHYFATRCVECGVDFATLADWLGHQDRGVTAAKFYFHRMTPHTRAMAARVQIAA